jgi:hypothetical protein
MNMKGKPMAKLSPANGPTSTIKVLEEAVETSRLRVRDLRHALEDEEERGRRHAEALKAEREAPPRRIRRPRLAAPPP